MAREAKPAGRAPTEASLQEAALAHLARFSATELGLRRVLVRRVERWARRAEADGQPGESVAAALAAGRAAAAEVAKRLVAAGAVDDAAFAEARSRRLARGGKSRRAISAHLAAKGVAGDVAQAVLPDDELGAALMACRRRRLGPFARAPMDREARLKALGTLARAGFSQRVASQALGMATEEAEERVRAMRDA